ncbi:MAG: AEC family transporter [Phycisphaerales bacterium]|jgi:predicted permease
MEVINTVLPVFVIIATGALLHRFNFFSADFVKEVNKLVFWVGLPALLFGKIASAEYNYRLAGETFLVVLAGMFCCIVAAYIVALLFRMPAPKIGAFVQGAFRGNLYFIGLVLIIYSFADCLPETSAHAENITVLVLAFIIPVYNIVSVVILLIGTQKLDRYVSLRLTKQIIANPLFLACVAGIIYPHIFPPLPLAIDRSLNAIGQISLPLALIGIGATLVRRKIAGHSLYAFVATVIKIVVAPLVGIVVASWLNLGEYETKIAVLLLACPTAATSYVMAEQLGADERLSAAVVVLSTVLSIFSLSIVVLLF